MLQRDGEAVPAKGRAVVRGGAACYPCAGGVADCDGRGVVGAPPVRLQHGVL
jgi:hypothetical protein